MKVLIKNPCKAAGEFFKPDDQPNLADSDAKALIESGAAVALNGNGASKPEDANTLHEAIREAVALLDTDNADLWTKGGAAKTEAIESALGYNITAAERDAAMADA